MVLLLAAVAGVLAWRSGRVQERLSAHRLDGFLRAYRLAGLQALPDSTRGVKHLTYSSDDGLVFEARFRRAALIESWVMAQGDGWTKSQTALLRVFGDHFAAVTGAAGDSRTVNDYRAWLRPRLAGRRTREQAYGKLKVDLQFAPAFVIQDLK